MGEAVHRSNVLIAVFAVGTCDAGFRHQRFLGRAEVPASGRCAFSFDYKAAAHSCAALRKQAVNCSTSG
jgi:hypothetical protein